MFYSLASSIAYPFLYEELIFYGELALGAGQKS